MASNQDQASYRVGEAKGHTQEKAGQVTGAAKETAYEAKDRAAGTAQAVKDKASETAQAAKDRTVEGKDQTGGFLGEKTAAARQKAAETAEAAKQAAPCTQDRTSDAAPYTKDSAVAGKDKTGSVLQQAGEQVMGAVVGAKDAVVNTLGMGGDKKADDGSGTTTTKDTSVTEKITGDH